MKITPYGAAGGEVTGSAYLVETDSASVLIDCGLFQGGKDAAARNRAPLGCKVAELDAVVLTHGHLDHTGRLPLLAKAGYSGPIYATPATVEMTGLILRDSAKIQSQDIERQNRKRERAGESPLEPLYSPAEAEQVLLQLQPATLEESFDVAPGIRARMIEAGHMLGSASIELAVREGGRERLVAFSGDLGPTNAPILKDAETFPKADVVFLETTYGDRDHRPFRETAIEFFEIIKQAVAADGKILVPTFAVGRAQLLTMLLAYAFRKGLVKPIPVFLDSPMAIEAWKIYERHVELFDDEMLKFIHDGSVRKDLATMKPSVTAEDSKKINDIIGSCLVMAGAGMCTAGRILHHFKQNLWKPETHVIIVGYQAYGSLGRRLVEGEKMVKIFGEQIAVKAHIHTLGGFSAHAGQTDLLKWFEPLAGGRPLVVLTHGEDGPRRELAKQIQQRHGLKPLLPGLREVIEV
jgi:metallo-beta-lactamase family protein